MERAAYLDTSALVKLILHEQESEALVHYLHTPRRVISSALSAVETVRACRRASWPAHEAQALMQAVEQIALDPGVVRAAAALSPAALRSLDAIHLASAQRVNDPDLEFVTYDARLAEAARSHGLRVVQPGR